MSKRTIQAANSAIANDGLIGVFVANEFTEAPENWVLLAPYGRFPNPQCLQVFTPEDAHTIANEFNGALNPRRLFGLPFYIGHPDHPAFKDRHNDVRAYGRIKALEAREAANCAQCATFCKTGQGDPCVVHGLWGKVKWSEDAKALIANEAFAGHSVNWRLRKVGSEWHPFSLKSVGFTNEPNIPVPTITTANETLQVEWAANEELLQAHFQKLAGIRLAANATVKAHTRMTASGPVLVQQHERKEMFGHTVEEVPSKMLKRGDIVFNRETGRMRTVLSDAQQTHHGYYRAETDSGEPVNIHGDDTVIRKAHLNMEGKPASDGGEYARAKAAGIAERNAKMMASQHSLDARRASIMAKMRSKQA